MYNSERYFCTGTLAGTTGRQECTMLALSIVAALIQILCKIIGGQPS